MDSIAPMMAAATGLCLAATAGLRTFLPLLAVGLIGASGLHELHPALSFLAHPLAMLVVGAVAAAEVLADKIPGVDHVLDAVGLILKPVTATVVSMSLLPANDPLFALAVGLMAGGTMAAGLGVAKAKLRLLSSAVTSGFGNVVLSLIEDGVVIVGMVLAVVLPLAAATVLFFAFGLLVFATRHFTIWRYQKLASA